MMNLARVLLLFFDLGVLGLSALLYQKIPGSTLPDYPLQVVILAGLAAGLSGSLWFSPEKSWMRLGLLFLRTIVFALLVTTLPVIDLRVLPLFTSFTLVLALWTAVPSFLGLQVSWLTVCAICFLAFADSFPPFPRWGEEVQLLAGTMAAVTVCALVFRLVVSELKAEKAQNVRLQNEISRLANANIGFQEFAAQLERASTHAERLRLSREIHDSVGYTLTTLKMLFEAAKGLIVKEPAKLGGLMEEGAVLSSEALQEIRMILRELRHKVDSSPEGMHFVHQLVRTFEKVCGIRVRLEFTNTRNSYGEVLDPILFRMIQEGMTNAFNHGHATEITIILTESFDSLAIFIRDNGKGSSAIEKGIGLAGMEERIAGAGGSVSYRTLESGFEVSATLPIRSTS